MAPSFWRYRKELHAYPLAIALLGRAILRGRFPVRYELLLLKERRGFPREIRTILKFDCESNFFGAENLWQPVAEVFPVAGFLAFLAPKARRLVVAAVRRSVADVGCRATFWKTFQGFDLLHGILAEQYRLLTAHYVKSPICCDYDLRRNRSTSALRAAVIGPITVSRACDERFGSSTRPSPKAPMK